MAQLIFWAQLSTRSRRAIRRQVTTSGKPYRYNPRGDLLRRLAQDNGMTIDAVYQQLLIERSEILRDSEI